MVLRAQLSASERCRCGSTASKEGLKQSYNGHLTAYVKSGIEILYIRQTAVQQQTFDINR